MFILTIFNSLYATHMVPSIVPKQAPFFPAKSLATREDIDNEKTKEAWKNAQKFANQAYEKAKDMYKNGKFMPKPKNPGEEKDPRPIIPNSPF